MEMRDALEEALLDGVSCEAYAWVVTRQVQNWEAGRAATMVGGIRTWHGYAVLAYGKVPPEWRFNRVLRYEGPVHDGDEVRRVEADVYIHRTMRQKTKADAERDLLQVWFTGAGNLPRA